MSPDAATALFLWILCPLLGAVTAKIASDRGVAPKNIFLWWLAGTFFFIITIPLAIFIKPDPKILEAKALKSGAEKKCPQCAELVKREATKCRFCGFDFQAGLSPMIPCPSCRRQIPRSLTRCTFCRTEIRSV